METLLAAETITIPLSYVITFAVFTLSILAGFVGWLGNVSVTLGKLTARTEVRVENLESMTGSHAVTLVTLDQRLDDHQQRLVLLEQPKPSAGQQNSAK